MQVSIIPRKREYYVLIVADEIVESAFVQSVNSTSPIEKNSNREEFLRFTDGPLVSSLIILYSGGDYVMLTKSKLACYCPK